MSASLPVAIHHAESDAEIIRCLPVMQDLRPKLSSTAFVTQVRRQEAEGFRLAFLECEGEIRAVAGYRIMHKLYNERAMYVDDLVTREADRSKGFGDQLFDWLVQTARQLDCRELELDSGTHRTAAHRFYLRKRMAIGGFHFVLKLTE